MLLRLTVASTLLAGCGGARSSPRPDECTPEELGWTDDDGCFFTEKAEFFSDERQDCGLSNRWPHPIGLCHASLTFDGDEVWWRETDFYDRSTYQCDGETLTFEPDDITASWDANTNVLTWRGLAYLPRCPQ